MTRGAPGGLLLVLLAAVVGCAQNTAGVLHVGAPPGVPVLPEVLVTRWADGEGAPVVADVAAPGRALLPPGTYALRLAGTDHRHGPVRLGTGRTVTVTLGVLSVGAPPEAARTWFFALHPSNGAAAARVPSDGSAVAAFPGRYDLVRDRGEVSRPVEIPPGGVLRLEAGALHLEVPGEVTGQGVSVLDVAGQRIEASVRLGEGSSALLPGRYRLLLDGTGRLSVPFTIAAGEITRLPLAAVRVSSLQGQGASWVAFAPEDLRSAASGPSGRTVALLPGDYAIATRKAVAAAGGDAAKLPRGPVFRALPGVITRFWIAPGGGFLAGGQGEVPVHLVLGKGRQVPIGAGLRVRVVLAERCDLVVTPLRADGSGPAGKAVQLRGAGPLEVEIPLALAPDLPDATPFLVEARATPPGGALLRGVSAPALAVRTPTAPVRNARIKELTPTTATLSWDAPEEGPVAGYHIYRAPRGQRPLATLPAGTTTFRDLGLSAGRPYTWRICPVDPRGLEGPPSPPLHAVTPRHGSR